MASECFSAKILVTMWVYALFWVNALFVNQTMLCKIVNITLYL